MVRVDHPRWRQALPMVCQLHQATLSHDICPSLATGQGSRHRAPGSGNACSFCCHIPDLSYYKLRNSALDFLYNRFAHDEDEKG